MRPTGCYMQSTLNTVGLSSPLPRPGECWVLGSHLPQASKDWSLVKEAYVFITISRWDAEGQGEEEGAVS